MKMCVRCKVHKPIESFWKEKGRPDGHKAACAECVGADNKLTPEDRKKRKDALKTATTKVCRTCKEEKPKAEFRIANGNTDKLENQCEKCYDSNRRAQYKKNPGPHNESVKKWKENNPEKHRLIRDSAAARFKAANPKIQAAWDATQYAMKTGELVKTPCEMCGATPVEAHHPSYEPENHLWVQWLCHHHHYQANRIKEKIKYLGKFSLTYKP